MATTSDVLRVTCSVSFCGVERTVTKAQASAGGFWLCPNHRSERDAEVSGWGFVNELEVDIGFV